MRKPGTSYDFKRHRADLYQLENLDGPEIGESAADFEATTLDGQTVRLSDLYGKIIVLENSSVTCPQYIGNSGPMNRLVTQYPDVKFVMLYTREAYPGENIREHHSLDEKLARAQSLRQKVGENRSVWVDSLEGIGHLAYGSLLNMIYIIAPDGTVVFRGHWNNPKAVEKVLDKLQRGESISGMRSPFRMVAPTTMKVVAEAGPTALWDMALCMPNVMWIHLKQEFKAVFS